MNIPVPIANTDENGYPGGETINSIKLSIQAQAGFVTSPTDSATESIAPGETKTLTPSFVVDSNATDGSYTVTIKVVSTDIGIDPDPSSAESDIQVSFTVDTTSPTVSLRDANNKDIQGVAYSTQAVVASATDAGSGVADMRFQGPSTDVTLSFCKAGRSCPKSVKGGPVRLSTGSWTVTATDAAENSKAVSFTVDAGTLKMDVYGTGPAASREAHTGISEAQALGWSTITVTSVGADIRGQVGHYLDQACVRMSVVSPYGSGTGPICEMVCEGTGCTNEARRTFYGPAQSWAGGSFRVFNSSSIAAWFGVSIRIDIIDSQSDADNATLPFWPQSEYNPTASDYVYGIVDLPQLGQNYPAPGPSNMQTKSKYSGTSCSSPSPSSDGLLAMIRQLLGLPTPPANCSSSYPVYTSTVPISFVYQDVPGGVVTDTTTLKIYQFDGVEWDTSPVTNQAVVVDTSGWISVSGYAVSGGTFAALFVGNDSSAPVTSLALASGATTAFDGTIFLSTDNLIILTSTDPVVNGFASQVSTIWYRVDASSSGSPFSAYSSSISLALGAHALDYRAQDWKGNLEAVKTSTFVVTAGDVGRFKGDVTVNEDLLVGFFESGAKFEAEADSSNQYVLKVTSADGSAMFSVDNIGDVAIGTPSFTAPLNIAGNSGDGTIGLQLRAGNSTGSVTSSQIAFGLGGEASHRHLIRTQHNDGTAGNRMSFWVWTPGTGSTSTVANMNVLALEAISAASGGSMHVRPAGTPDVELEVSDGASTGGGTIHRASAGAHSSRELKKDIRHLTFQDEERALADVLALTPVSFRYKRQTPRGLVDDPGRPLMKGLLYEQTPESIRGPGETIVIDSRVANVELALKAAIRKLEALEERLARAQQGEKTK